MPKPTSIEFSAMNSTIEHSTRHLSQKPQHALLTVILRGIKNDHGVVRVALFTSKATFPSDKPFRGYVGSVKHGVATITIEDIPFGEYAIAAFHDENNNERLDQNILGIPTEGYGFSNNARGVFGPPSFEDAKFSIRLERHTITIDIY